VPEVKIRSLLVGLLLFTTLCAVVATPAGATTESRLHAKLLANSDMPPGWSGIGVGDSSEASAGGCAATAHSPREPSATVGFTNDLNGVQAVYETLETGPEAASLYSRLVEDIRTCGRTSNGERIKTIRLPPAGTESSAYGLSIPIAGKVETADIVIFLEAPYAGALLLGSTTKVDTTLLQTLVTKALADLTSTTISHVHRSEVVTCTTVSHNDVSCLAPGWQTAFSVTFEGRMRVPKHLGACLARELPRGFHLLLLTAPQGQLSNAEASNEATMQNAFSKCS
jgi:hypothetical protein